MATVTRTEREACRYCLYRGIRALRKHLRDDAQADTRVAVVCTNSSQDQRRRNCDECANQHENCEDVADVVMGNHCDLWDLIDWTDEILGHTVDIQGTAVAFLTTPEKRRVLKAVIELMAGFQRGENLHREAHGIDIAPRQRQLNGDDIRYNTLVANLTSITQSRYPGPPPAHPDGLRLWESARLLRLVYPDRGFLDINMAKQVFGDAIFRILKRKGDAAEEAVLMARFPVHVPVFA